MSGADFFYGTTYRAFGGGWSGEPSVSRVDDDIDVGKNLKSSCGNKPEERRLMTDYTQCNPFKAIVMGSYGEPSNRIPDGWRTDVLLDTNSLTSLQNGSPIIIRRSTLSRH